MVVDVKKLSDALRRSSPEKDLRRDLQRLIDARKAEIDDALESGKSYWLRVPDGRQIRISRRIQPVEATQ
jgi:hypothetical protein